MRRTICAILAIVLGIGMMPFSVFAEESVLYTATVDVFSTEYAYDTCQVYIYEDDCYMNIGDIVRYTRSAYTVVGDVLTVTHGTRSMKINLTNNKLSEDGITAEMKALRNGNTIVVHAFPMLTYLGATCDVADEILTIRMPECTVWEGLLLTGQEQYVGLDVFGNENEQKARLILNGILHLLDADIAHCFEVINCREAILLTTQINVAGYIDEWKRKTNSENKQMELFPKVVEIYDLTAATEEKTDIPLSVLEIVMQSVGWSLEEEEVFSEFKDTWDDGTGYLSSIYTTMKHLSNNKKAAEDSVAMIGTCAKYLPSTNDFGVTLSELEQTLYNDRTKTVSAIFFATIEEALNYGTGKLFEKLNGMAANSLKAGVLVNKLLDGNRDSFAYATAETNAIYLLRLKNEIADVLDGLGERILSDNYSNQQDIEDYRLIMAFYYRVLIAANEQLEKVIVAQDRQNDADMAPVIEKLHANSEEFAKNLYILTTANGAAFPDIARISASNPWDTCSAISVNAEEVSRGLAGLGVAAMTQVVSGIEADSIQYYKCTNPVDFCVIGRDGKYGLVDYSGNIILPIEYESIGLYETGPGQEHKLYAYDVNYQGYWIEQDGTRTMEFLGGWGFASGAEIYWWNEPVMFDYFEGRVPYSYEAYASYPHGTNVLGTITKGTADVIPVQQINGSSETTSYGQTTYTVKKVSEKYALLNLKTETLVTDFIFDDYGYSGFVEGVLAVSKGDKWGYIKENGEMITDFIYDASEVTPWGNKHMYSALNNYIIVRQGDLWGLLDTEGNIVVDVAYEGISQVNPDGLFWLAENGIWSLYKLES